MMGKCSLQFLVSFLPCMESIDLESCPVMRLLNSQKCLMWHLTNFGGNFSFTTVSSKTFRVNTKMAARDHIATCFFYEVGTKERSKTAALVTGILDIYNAGSAMNWMVLPTCNTKNFTLILTLTIQYSVAWYHHKLISNISILNTGWYWSHNDI